MSFALLFLADLGVLFGSWNTHDSFHSLPPTMCQTVSLILWISVKVGLTASILYLRNLKLWEIKLLIQNQTVQMKSGVLLAYQSVKCLAWVSPFLSSNVGVFLWWWMTTTLAQWFSPISDSKWFFLARMVVGEEKVLMPRLTVDEVCFSGLHLDFTQGSFVHNGLCLSHIFCVKYYLEKISFIIKMGGFLAFMFCKISL